MKKKLWIAACTAFVTLLMMEGGMRAWLAFRGRPHDATALVAEFKRLVDPGRAFAPRGADEQERDGAPALRPPLLHPFSGSETAHDTGGVLAAFRAGLEPDEYSVMVVGGSVAASWATAAASQAQQLLAADPRLQGKRIRLLNYAHAAYKQPQQVTRLAYLFSLGYRPDAIINLDGFNEVALTLQNLQDGTHPVYPSAPVWGALIRSTVTVDEEQLEWAGRLWTLRKEAGRQADRALRWKLQHSSLSIRAVCAERGVFYLHVLQPTLLDAGAKVQAPEEIALGAAPFGWQRGAEEGYPLLRAAGSELLGRGVSFHDASRIFAGFEGPLYYDHCHLNPLGNSLMGESVLNAFLANLPVVPLPPGESG